MMPSDTKKSWAEHYNNIISAQSLVRSSNVSPGRGVKWPTGSRAASLSAVACEDNSEGILLNADCYRRRSLHNQEWNGPREQNGIRRWCWANFVLNLVKFWELPLSVKIRFSFVGTYFASWIFRFDQGKKRFRTLLEFHGPELTCGPTFLRLF